VSFLYPRTVTIRRPNPPATAAIGALAYQGVTAANETVILTGLPASIQHASGKGQHGYLPSDASHKADWYVYIPAAAAPLGAIAERDIVVDDLGKRYQVAAAYWNSLGHRLFVELLQI
jgi:hypothetical protein